MEEVEGVVKTSRVKTKMIITTPSPTMIIMTPTTTITEATKRRGEEREPQPLFKSRINQREAQFKPSTKNFAHVHG